MGYDLLEDNEMAALDGSRNGGKFANDINLPNRRLMSGNTKTPVNVTPIIKNIAKKYSQRITTCEEADKTIENLEDEIEYTSSLIKKTKSKEPNNQSKILKLTAQMMALSEQLQFVYEEKNRLKCLEDIKGGDDYVNMTDVSFVPSSSKPQQATPTQQPQQSQPQQSQPTQTQQPPTAQDNQPVPPQVIVVKKSDIDPFMLGVGLLAFAVIGAFLSGGMKNN